MATDPLALDRFRREVRTARAVTHPNVCRIHDIGEEQGRAFLSMEYVDGEDLAIALKRLGRPSKEKAMDITRQICLGLAAVHEAGIVHRDLKPSNIMVDGRGNVRLMDFGIAGLQQEQLAGAQAVGTPLYMAPELFNGANASARTDIYALGLVLYEIFTGKRAFQGGEIRRFVDRSQTTTPTAPSTYIADIDPLVERAILRCLDPDPKLRPGSVYALLALLPGGNPLAAAVAAGQTPSPEMVAAAGDEGVMDRRPALLYLGGVFVGLALVCWLAKSTYLFNQIKEWKHPEVLAEQARGLLKQWGYAISPRQASGFEKSGNTIQFWFRQRQPPYNLWAYEFYSDWGQFSLARVTGDNPTVAFPGDVDLRLDLAGRLEYFRAIPESEPGSSPATNLPNLPNWSKWFPKELTGIDLDSWAKVDERRIPPPDAYHHVQWWRGPPPKGTNGIYVQAAAYCGRPGYFSRFSLARVETASLASDPELKGQQLGRDATIAIYWLLLLSSAVLAWLNLRTGRSDLRGSLRVVLFLFVCGMLAWLFLATHPDSLANEAGALEMGAAQALYRAAVFWLFYTAMEPFVRRYWPQTLISWTRLVEGRWRDPIIGRDLLVGATFGVATVLLVQLEVLAPWWLGLKRRPYLFSSILGVEGLAATLGAVLYALQTILWVVLFIVIFLVIVRLIVRNTVCAWLLALAMFTTTSHFMDRHHPILGWLVVSLTLAASFWLLARFGLLSMMVGTYTHLVLMSPITPDLSRWYAGSGLLCMTIIAVMAVWGFYASQGGRPIWRDPLSGPPS